MRGGGCSMAGLIRDSRVILAAFAASCALGLMTNSLRHAPLPMVYENPEERTLRSVSSAPDRMSREPEILEFKAALKMWKDRGTLFLDARDSAFFEEGHIPGALSLPREEILRAKAMPELADKSRPVLVYCAGEDCEDSKIVAKALLAMGHAKVAVYEGGWEEWAASGSPVEK